MTESSRYIIGIDLGTTHCSVAYVDTNREKNPSLGIRPFSVPQVTGAGLLEPKPTLPSFFFLGEKGPLPWAKGAADLLGHYALELGARTPTRLVQSAKSWLCNAAASRRDAILPVECYEPDKRMSPVDASGAYLRHIRDAWNYVMARSDAEADFDSQEVILTVPASFDEVARTLTVEAAKEAGFQNLSLLEEPQAAFYSWIFRHEQDWQDLLNPGDQILVCDVGGGTTDFSIIRVEEGEGKLRFQRQAVGRHLLLGGDNLDTALCHHLESKLEDDLDSQQFLQLRDQARRAKEELMQGGLPCYTAVLQGSGSSFVAGSMTAELGAEEAQELLLEGFFGQYSWEEALELKSSSGMQVMGLPYESEPSIVKHLAAFLESAAQQMTEPVRPGYILFNGGTMKPALFQDAVLQNLERWQGHCPEKLNSHSLDLAVSQGAAYFGRARRGMGVRISGGLPRAYYLTCDVQGEQQALTLLGRGSEAGTRYISERLFEVLPNTPVAFQLLSSQVRLHDKAGDWVTITTDEMASLPPIHTVLRFGKSAVSDRRIPVRLGIELTEIGTVELWLDSVDTDHRWSLEFQLKRVGGEEDSLAVAGETRMDETYDESYLEDAQRVLESLFAEPRTLKPEQAMAALEKALNCERADWVPSVLRGLWEALLPYAAKRRVSTAHEARWWNLAGFFVRPGRGFPLDDFRIKELWKLFLSDARSKVPKEVSIQKWICLRRIAAGLNRGQQTQIANQILPQFLSKGGIADLKDAKLLYEYHEQLRCVASMELIDLGLKAKLGKALVKRILSGKGGRIEYWALARLGARQLLYGGVGQVLPPEVCTQWLESLCDSKRVDLKEFKFVIQALGRQTEQRELNLSSALVEKVLTTHKIKLPKECLSTAQALTSAEQERMYGEQLPVGLALLD